MKSLSLFFLTFFYLVELCSIQVDRDGSPVFHYFCTSADAKHYPLLINLIASIHKVDFDHLDEIAVFDLGLDSEQKKSLEKIEKVKVYEIEMTHLDLLQYFHTGGGKNVRGWYAWKPVAMKQGLDMFPYLMYLDAGSLVLTSPDDLFRHIKQNGYFLIDVYHNIVNRITYPVLDKIVSKLPKDDQDLVLHNNTWMIAGGVQGLSRSVYYNYIFPMYLLSSNLALFMDDQSAKMGFGSARHDQTLFSIFARVLKFNVNQEGWSNLTIDGKKVPFHYHYHWAEVTESTCIYSCRWDDRLATDKIPFIHWKQ